MTEQKIDSFESLIEYLDEKFLDVDRRISALPTKAFLANKLDELEGRLGTKIRKEDSKLNRLTEILNEKGVINDTDVKELSNIVVFIE